MQMLVSKLAESALAPGIVDPVRRQAKIYDVCTEMPWNADTTAVPQKTQLHEQMPQRDTSAGLTTEMTARTGHKWVLLNVDQWTICSYEQ